MKNGRVIKSVFTLKFNFDCFFISNSPWRSTFNQKVASHLNETKKNILKSFLLVFLDLMLVRRDFNSRAFEIWAAHRRCRLLLQLTKQKAFLSKNFLTFLDRV